MPNIENTFQHIRDLSIAVSYQQVEKWVMSYDEKPILQSKNWWKRLFKSLLKKR